MNIPSIITKRVEKEIISFCRHLPGKPKELYEPMRYTLESGGKNIRPSLLLLTCKMLGGKMEDAISPAVAVELFHNFTLIHDDITDNSPLRRNNPAVHVKWNSNVALLSGDALLIKAYQELAKTVPSKLCLVVQLFNDAALKVCEGQQFDMNYEKEKDISMDDYLNMISLKTAALFGLSMELGAVCAGASGKVCRDMKTAGVNLGMLFQLKDDVLDVFGKPGKTGKQTGGDIIQDKKTFLLIKALELANGKTKAELNSLIGNARQNESFGLAKIAPDDKVIRVKNIYKKLEIEKHANEQMEIYFYKTKKLLTPIKTPEKDILLALASSLLEREV